MGWALEVKEIGVEVKTLRCVCSVDRTGDCSYCIRVSASLFSVHGSCCPSQFLIDSLTIPGMTVERILHGTHTSSDMRESILLIRDPGHKE